MSTTDWQRYRDVAERIAARLFVNGDGQHAERLVLTVDGPPSRNLGGWCKEAVVGQIVSELASAENNSIKD